MLNITDFAKDLLFGMRFGIGEQGEELRLGAVGIPLLYRSTIYPRICEIPVAYLRFQDSVFSKDLS